MSPRETDEVGVDNKALVGKEGQMKAAEDPAGGAGMMCVRVWCGPRESLPSSRCLTTTAKAIVLGRSNHRNQPPTDHHPLTLTSLPSSRRAVRGLLSHDAVVPASKLADAKF